MLTECMLYIVRSNMNIRPYLQILGMLESYSCHTTKFILRKHLSWQRFMQSWNASDRRRLRPYLIRTLIFQVSKLKVSKGKMKCASHTITWVRSPDCHGTWHPPWGIWQLPRLMQEACEGKSFQRLCYRVQALSALLAAWQANESWRQGVGAKNTTLFGKPADREDGRRVSPKNHLIGVWMPISFTESERERWWGSNVKGPSVLQISPGMTSLREGRC